MSEMSENSITFLFQTFVSKKINSKALIFLTLLGATPMPKAIPVKTVTPFSDAVSVCRALHDEDQPFTVKLLQRDSSTGRVTSATFKHAVLAEQASMFASWRHNGVEPFVMVGQTPVGGISRENVSGTWTLAVDLDHEVDMLQWTNSLIRPTFAVETSEGRYHFAWVLKDPISNIEAKRFLIAISCRLDGDPCFAHSAQAVRLPGFVNLKHGREATLAISADPLRCYTAAQISLGLDVDLVTACMRSSFPPLDRNLNLPKAIPQEHILADLTDALNYVAADDYEQWIKVTVALHSVGPEAYEIWDKWSQKSEKYDEKIMRKKWDSFGKGSSGNSVSASSIFFLAARAGWSNPGYRKEMRDFSAESLTERSVGRMIAEKMGPDFASIRVGSGDKESYRLLEWDGDKYANLDNSVRRERVEHFLRGLIAEMGEKK
jgi:hypothetical protein